MKVDFETLDAVEKALFAAEKAIFISGELCEVLGTTEKKNEMNKERLELLSNIAWDYINIVQTELNEVVANAELRGEV